MNVPMDLTSFIAMFPSPLSALMFDNVKGRHLVSGGRLLDLTDIWHAWNRIAGLKRFWTYVVWIDKSTDPEMRTLVDFKVLVDPYQLGPEVAGSALVPVIVIDPRAAAAALAERLRSPPYPNESRYQVGQTIKVRKERLFRRKWQCATDRVRGSLAWEST